MRGTGSNAFYPARNHERPELLRIDLSARSGRRITIVRKATQCNHMGFNVSVGLVYRLRGRDGAQHSVTEDSSPRASAAVKHCLRGKG